MSYAYKLIRRLNAELESEGFVTIKGRISTQYFMERIYGMSTDKEVGIDGGYQEQKDRNVGGEDLL